MYRDPRQELILTIAWEVVGPEREAAHRGPPCALEVSAKGRELHVVNALIERRDEVRNIRHCSSVT